MPPRNPPRPRPSPTGFDVKPKTQMGVLRLILAMVIFFVFQSSITKLLELLGLSGGTFYNTIKYQKNYYQTYGRWDNLSKKTKAKSRLRYSKIRVEICKTFNSMSFPVKLRALQVKLLAKGINIRRDRLLRYAAMMGMYPKSTKKVINASDEEKCKQRVLDAKNTLAVLDCENTEWTKRWKVNPRTPYRFYYYDQCSVNQLRLTSDVVLVPKKLITYEKNRNSCRSESITMHAICDQYGQLFYYELVRHGQDEEAIREFLLRAADGLPRGPKGQVNLRPTLFFDHLQSHQNIHDENTMNPDYPWSTELTPLSYPDGSVIEVVFCSFKAHLRTHLLLPLKVLGGTKWVQHVEGVTARWAKNYVGDDAILERTKTCLHKLIEHGGDLQSLALADAGYDSEDQIKMELLSVDQRDD